MTETEFYRKALKEFHPDNQNSLPTYIKNEVTSELNKFRDSLEMLRSTVRYFTEKYSLNEIAERLEIVQNVPGQIREVKNIQSGDILIHKATLVVVSRHFWTGKGLTSFRGGEVKEAIVAFYPNKNIWTSTVVANPAVIEKLVDTFKEKF